MHSQGAADAFVSPQSYAPLSYQRTQTTTQHYLPSPPSSQSSDAAAAKRQSSTLLYLGAEVNELWNSYLDALEANPLLVKSITAGVILGAADLSGQAIQQVTAATTKEIATMEDDTMTSTGVGVDIARFVRFAFFGFILQAPWNHFYYQLLDGALPPTVDPFTSTTFIKVLIDQFIQAPIFTVLIFGFLGVLEGKSLDAIKDQLDDDYVDTMVANWKLWVPATVVNIAFCPPILRVLFLNVVFFFWSIFLSLKLNKTEE
jgi:peroxisomal membrane protein 2